MNQEVVRRLEDLDDSAGLSEDFHTRAQAYRMEADQLIAEMKARGELYRNATNLPSKIRDELMEKHGISNWKKEIKVSEGT